MTPGSKPKLARAVSRVSLDEVLMMSTEALWTVKIVECFEVLSN
jgi:hypothetical protein